MRWEFVFFDDFLYVVMVGSWDVVSFAPLADGGVADL